MDNSITLDDENQIDEVFIPSAHVHLERMDDNEWALTITPTQGRESLYLTLLGDTLLREAVVECHVSADEIGVPVRKIGTPVEADED